MKEYVNWGPDGQFRVSKYRTFNGVRHILTEGGSMNGALTKKDAIERAEFHRKRRKSARIVKVNIPVYSRYVTYPYPFQNKILRKSGYLVYVER